MLWQPLDLCFQWIIIPWLALCLPRPTEKVSPWNGILIAVFVMGVSVLLALVDKKSTNCYDINHTYLLPLIYSSIKLL
jgi:hypothetical protein